MYSKSDNIVQEGDKYEIIFIPKGPDPKKMIEEKLDEINPANAFMSYVKKEADIRDFSVNQPIEREIDQNCLLLNDFL